MSLRLEPGRFFGSKTASHTPAGLILTETAYARDASLPRHSHEAPYLCLVVSGAYEESCGSRVEACTRGALLFHPTDSVHADRFGDAGGTCFNIQFGPEWSDRLDESGVAAAGWKRLRETSSALAGRVRREAWSPDTLSALSIESLVLAVLVEAGRAGRRPAGAEPAWIRRARERLAEGLRSPPALSAMAADAGVGAAYFARAFRAHVGCTPGEYVRALRVQRASEMLRGTLSLAEIALELGYADQAHFTRQFRDAVGIPPGAFRRSRS
jgi:AraC family transcriptional regulator